MLGRRIGHYEIQSLLGAGGMGEVYLATDVMLDRPVAVKILPPQFTQDIAQVRRFEREARAASALNNPNIITIHEIGREGDVHFIATEFIEGRTLRQLLANGRLPADEVVGLAAQIAKALSAAHAAGIVHRDIKPENVMVRPDGLVKVLDFGLAKPCGREPAAGTMPAHSAVSLQTDADMLMGTASYLSPEQVLRRQVDHRTDIFSLGVVLYEMLAGERPFKGDSVAEVFDAILNSEPAPFTSHHSPVGLNRVLARALAKDAAARYQTADELRAELARFAQAADGARPPRMRKWAALVAVLVMPSALGLWLWQMRREPPPPRVTFAAAAQKLTDLPGEEVFPSLVPDGQSFIFSSSQNGNWDIYRQAVGERAAVNLTAGADGFDIQPAYSPDGARVAFRSSRDGGGVFVMNNDGSNITQVADAGFNPTWSPDGNELALNDDNISNYESRNTYPSASKLWAVNVTTRARRVITTRDAVQSNWSPHGWRLAF